MVTSMANLFKWFKDVCKGRLPPEVAQCEFGCEIQAQPGRSTMNGKMLGFLTAALMAAPMAANAQFMYDFTGVITDSNGGPDHVPSPSDRRSAVRSRSTMPMAIRL